MPTISLNGVLLLIHNNFDGIGFPTQMRSRVTNAPFPGKRWIMKLLRYARLPACMAFLLWASACQPTLDLDGSYWPIDFPWSGHPQVDVSTSFPSPVFAGMFRVGFIPPPIEIPIFGIINSQNEISFLPCNEELSVTGLCVCQAFDDGSSLYPGSGEIAGDGIADRLACHTYLGQPFDPPLEIWRTEL